jgi:hypothetical protein
MTDTMRIHDPPSQPPGGEERRASEADAVDKNARPAGRRFQSFTPPDLAALGQRPGVAESTPPSPVVVGSLLRAKVRRRDLLVALTLAVAAALVVAAMMRVHVAERDRQSAMSSAATPASTPAAVSAVALPASPPAEPVASATTSAVAEVAPPVPSVTTRVLAPATASTETPPEPDRPPPGPHPLAPVEPPF